MRKGRFAVGLFLLPKMPRRSPPPKFRGEQAECAFIHAAMERGLVVSVPLSDSAGYDLIIDTSRPFDLRARRRGRLLRIQVKCAHLRAPNGFQFHAWRTNARKPLTCRDADFIACFVVPFGTWYIIPVQELVSMNIRLHPDVPNSRGRFERFRERWDLFLDARPLTSQPRRH